jgi:hypothetical protein
VCADLAVRRSPHTHEAIGRSGWDWLHNGDVYEDSPISSLLSLLPLQFGPSLGCGLAFVTIFGISVLRVSLGEVFGKGGDTWGTPGPNSKNFDHPSKLRLINLDPPGIES